MKKSAASLAICLLVLSPSRARGQDADAQRGIAAQALFEQAAREMDAGDYASACRKLEEVTKLAPDGLGAKLKLARCYEGQGRLASAWSQYATVKSMAARMGQTERGQAATEMVEALGPKLARMTIEVPADLRAIPGISVMRGGLLLGEAQWGTALPVDAGGHEIVVTAPGYKPWKRQVEVVADGASVTVAVPEKALVPEPSAQQRAPSPVLMAQPAPPDRTWLRPVGLSALGLGAAGVVAGAVFGGLAIERKGRSNADGHCDARNRCDDEGLALRDQAVGFAQASTWLLVTGGALAAGGMVLWLTSPRKDEPAPRAGLWVSPSAAGLQGTW
ncbi:tetratricopeptide repeat protein [Polyangium sorediatum]|uniref:PEGA domain-containing protein n=1 Tax=Polyangium sorediatum TaxID=889274 RepID=A0ABT6PBE3_9BACT|nr:tetratricopeptide repeat protein [Polyangium sorediatum]MDI1437450.1 hypothetical protein [Polyangium sorediatum]